MGCLGITKFGPVREHFQIAKLSGKGILSFKNGSYHAIARDRGGKIYCWGNNRFGQLGNKKCINEPETAQLIEALENENVDDVCCGDWHSLALTEKGEVFSWGDNKYGQIGHGKDEICVSDPVRLNGFPDRKVISIACGSYHSMALTETGQVYSWGLNKYGQLGIGNTLNKNSPTRIELNYQKYKITKISCGQKHSFILTESGILFTFGKNYLKLVSKHKNLMNPTEFSPGVYQAIASNNNYPFSLAVNGDNEVCEIGRIGSKKLRDYTKACKDGVVITSIEDYFIRILSITFGVKDFQQLNNASQPPINSSLNNEERISENEILRNQSPEHTQNTETLNETKRQFSPMYDGKYKKDFTEVDVLGKGGYGRVFKVKHKFEKITYAIKQIEFTGL